MFNILILLKLPGKIIKFFKRYKHLGFVILGTIAGGVAAATSNHKFSSAILAIVALVSLVSILWSIVQDIRVGTYGVDVLAAMAILAAILFGEYWTAIVIVLMFTGGEALEDQAEHRAKTELTALLDKAPIDAHLIRGSKETNVAIDTVKVGDKLIVKPGEIVPVDAIILEGSSDVDESSLTGESLPITKVAGEQIMSGSLNVSGPLTVKTTHTAADSQYSQIISLVKSAQKHKAPFVRMADRFAIPFTLLSLTIALGAWALSGESLRFLQVLVVATPCPLILGAPIALISGMSRAAKHGIIIKNGGALEKLASAQTLAFDKTGTLTRGTPIVKKINVYNGFKQADVLRYAASVEQGSVHILAAAIVAAATKANVKMAKAKGIQEVPGHGLQSVVGGKTVIVGRASMLREVGIPLPTQININKLAGTTAFVAVGNNLAGTILFEDELRPEAKKTLTKLKGLGLKHLMMITGDNKSTASSIAKKLGLTDVIADALPAGKLLAIEATTTRPVGFVGDGLNDAPVLTAADVGIALGARGSTAASESADVVIMRDNLEKVASSVAIAKRTMRVARQTVSIGIILSIALMFAFATGKFPPIAGAAIQEVIDIIVIIYALRAHSDGRRGKAAI